MDPATIAVILAQIGVSLYNQEKNREMTDSIKEEQRKAKENEIRNSQRRDMEKFLRSCDLQERLELKAHQHKVKCIRQGFMNLFTKKIHKDNVDKHYRLNVSPYIIQRSVIPQTEADIDNVRQELFCFLTGSNNANFNSRVLAYIDESIGGVISKFWNETSNHTICYYQNMWNISTNPFSVEDIVNLRVLIPTPTVAITPLFSECESGIKLTLQIYIWGVGEGDVLRQFEIDPEIKFEQYPTNYTKEERYNIIERVTAYAVCAIGQIADVFYWTNFYESPLLPSLLGKNLIEIPSSMKRQYAGVYMDLFSQLVLGYFSEEISKPDSIQLSKDIVDINLYNHPERCVAFLESLMNLSKYIPDSSSLIRESLISIYRAKTDLEVRNITRFNATLIHKEDINIIIRLVELAKDCNDQNLARDIIGIIKRKLLTWNK